MQNNENLTDRGYKSRLAAGSLDYRPNDSLTQFLNDPVLEQFIPRKGKALEIGCGLGSVFETWRPKRPQKWQFEAMDFSPSAIEYCLERHYNDVSYGVENICYMKKEAGYELIVDGHCLHSLTCSHERRQAYENITRYLNKGGVLVLEHMISHKFMNLSSDGQFEATSEIFTNKDGIESRYIPSARVFEDFLLSFGLEIVYLRAFSHKKFIPVDGREEALTSDPDVLRVIARKK